MKRNRLFSIGVLVVLALVLSGCRVTLEPTPAPVRNFTFESSWRVQGTNTWASCDNLDTYFEYTFHADNPSRIMSITEHYEGTVTGEEFTEPVQPRYWEITGNTVTVQAEFVANGHYLPLSATGDLESQAIVIRPIPNDPDRVNGGTNFHITVEYDGGAGTYTSRPVFVQAHAGCQPAD